MEVEIKNDENPIILDDPKGSITFNHVNFHYNEDRKILKDISFELEYGKSIAIVGPSGSGKSTIINLIPRIYDVIGGKVLFDGVDVRHHVVLYDSSAAQAAEGNWGFPQ